MFSLYFFVPVPEIGDGRVAVPRNESQWEFRVGPNGTNVRLGYVFAVVRQDDEGRFGRLVLA